MFFLVHVFIVLQRKLLGNLRSLKKQQPDHYTRKGNSRKIIYNLQKSIFLFGKGLNLGNNFFSDETAVGIIDSTNGLTLNFRCRSTTGQYFEIRK